MREATQLLTSGHFATSSIREKNSELQKSWMELKNLAAGRRHMLNDAMEVQRVGDIMCVSCTHLNVL